MLPLKCSNRSKIVFDHMRLSVNDVNTVFLCKKCVKYQYARRALCAYARVFQKRPGCALIGACALIRTNTVCVAFLTFDQYVYCSASTYILVCKRKR